MKRIVFLLLLLMSATFVFVSCSKDDNEDVVNNIEEDTRYYVKYEVKITSLHTGVYRTYTFNTENGEQVEKTKNSSRTTAWEGTYGPVKKGFLAKFTCKIDGSELDNTCQARIYVSREKEPFVVKAESSGTNKINISYKIDF